MHVRDQNYMSSYIYDHTGERVWKMAGEVQQMSINGQYFIDQMVFNEKTLYTSPYMIVTEAEYTKHYYIESERVTTKLGGGFQPAPLNPMTDHVQYPIGKEYANLADALWERLKYTEECTGLNPNYVTSEHNNLLYAFDQWVGMDNYESNAFYYHSDHLGSSSLITDANGQLDQHYQYLPYGEPFVSQKLNTGVRFTFSGKERDSETGLSYFGARYYSSDVSVWLSVDPLASQAPGWTPYRYGFNNPISFIDPSGKFEDWYQGKEGLVWSSQSVDEITFNGNIYTNVNKGSDELPLVMQGTDGANLLISGHKSGDYLNSAWERQTVGIAKGTSGDTRNVFAIVNNKEDMIKAFEVVTTNFGSVEGATIRSHGYSWGINLGFSSSDDFTDPTSINTFNTSLSSGRINISDNATVCFLGCNQKNLAYSFTSTTGISSVGADGFTGPQNSTGTFNVDGVGYYRFQRALNTPSGVLQINLGKKFNAAEEL